MVAVVERIWRSPAQSYRRLLPELLGIGHRGYTAELQRAMSDFGLDHSFAQATGKIKEHYGFKIPKSSLRKYTVENARRIASEAEPKTQSANSLPLRGVEQLVAQADGSMVAMVCFEGRSEDSRKNRKVDYKEVRLCACRSVGAEQTVYRAKIGQPEQIGQIWNQSAKDAGRGINTFVHVVGDGASWIQQQAVAALQCDRFLLDFFHGCEYIKAAEETCAQNNRWFTTQKKRLRRNASELVINDLAQHLEPDHLPDLKAPVRCAYRYLSNRLDQIDYKNSIEQGLPIGSGLIESGHKHVIQARMKIAGAAWSPPVADAMIQTRAHRASGLWQEFWKN